MTTSATFDENTRKIESIPLIWAALPVAILIALLACNVFIYKADSSYGPNQIALLVGAAVATAIGCLLHVKVKTCIDGMVDSIKSSLGAMLILLLIGGLTGAWIISGVVPAMVYYGLQILSPDIFLVATVLICSVVSLATGSSWTTVATVGVALIEIGKALGFSDAVTAGAIISGAYFGDKISPLSDTTNLAPAMAGTDLFTHIRYMLWTTVPTYLITIVAFVVLGLTIDASNSEAAATALSEAIESKFTLSPLLFLVPAAVIVMVIMKFDAAVALFIAMILGALVAVVFQPKLVSELASTTHSRFEFSGQMVEAESIDTTTTTESSAVDSEAEQKITMPGFMRYPLEAYDTATSAMANGVIIDVANEDAQKLLSRGGMSGMLNTIWLIFCAMCFGGAMEAVGLLERLTLPLVRMAKSTGALIGTTAASCLFLNVTASDQYLAIVVPGRMFRKTYSERGLAPQNLSRTLEDSGTVTSVLVPWNTCGATQSSVLGVDTLSYARYCVFNYVSPLMTVFFGAMHIAIAKKANLQSEKE
ncbi:MAG: Na+/H+ antiporter NhaC family protein [Pirellulaceae bacterium]